jgi:hypothetical protein|tara:strand:- start:26 stop:400 length:375 start_codon:yes stop_codon:yes gene_type:complete
MKHTILLASTGVLMGLLTSLVGLPGMVELSAWTGIYLLWIVYGLKVELPSPVRTMAFASTLAGLLAGSTQVILMERYKASNPWYASEFETSSASDMATAFLVQGIIAGLVFGLIVGAIVRWRQR